MASLFLDTSSNICFGVLDEELSWSSFHFHKEIKASKALHQMVYDLLGELGLDIKNIKKLFYLSGPGSYTGVRVAQGFAEVLELQGVSTLSCRHFELPGLLGVNAGAFISRAFKGEAFIYEWGALGQKQKLVKEPETPTILSIYKEQGLKLYTSEPDFYKEALSTYDLLQNNSQTIFSEMEKRNLKTSVFYYRDLQDEFRKGKA